METNIDIIKDLLPFLAICCLLKNNFEVSCQSTNLNEVVLPEVYKHLLKVNYDKKQNTDRISHREDGSDLSLKTLVRIVENGHSIFVCTEGEINSKKVDWYKDGKLLNVSFRNNMAMKEEPHVTIDINSILYILKATKKEEGVYTCTLDGIKIHEYNVKIVSLAKILDQDFIRYSMYLGFILSLTVTCYCAGLCVAWHRRASFADPLNLQYNYNQNNNYESAEQEALVKGNQN